MKTVRTISFVAVVLFLCACPTLGVVEFKDGLTHDINYQINDNVYVDYQAPYMYTTVNLLDGGVIPSDRFNWHTLNGYEHSRINISGGSINVLCSRDSGHVDISGGSISEIDSRGSSQVDISGGSIRDYLYSYGSSKVDISGGSIGHWLSSNDSSKVDISAGSIEGSLFSNDSSQVDIFGGSIGGWLDSYGSSQVNISGGSIGGDLRLSEQSEIQIFGSDFAINDQPFGYGELISILGGYPWDEPLRHLTGTLLSGELINNNFSIGNDARIILIPEPATLVLLSLGAILLIRKHNGR